MKHLESLAVALKGFAESDSAGGMGNFLRAAKLDKELLRQVDKIGGLARLSAWRSAGSLEALLAAGAADEEEFGPLLIASAQSGSESARKAKALLDAGADPNWSQRSAPGSKRGDTALACAAANGDAACCALLLSRGAASSGPSGEDWGIGQASQGWEAAALAEFVPYADLKALRLELKRTPLHLAAQGTGWTGAARKRAPVPPAGAMERKALDFVSLCAGLGADLDEPDALGSAPLDYAIRAKSLAMCKALAHFGAKLERVNAQGDSAQGLAEELGLLDLAGVFEGARLRGVLPDAPGGKRIKL